MGRAKKQAKKVQRGSDGGQSASYMGICQLTDQPGRLHRRIDIKVRMSVYRIIRNRVHTSHS
jgi:hypothetical protein